MTTQALVARREALALQPIFELAFDLGSMPVAFARATDDMI
jgi:hypothetical protein